MYRQVPLDRFLDTNIGIMLVQLSLFILFWSPPPLTRLSLTPASRVPFLTLLTQLYLVSSNQTDWETSRCDHISYLKVW